MFEYCSVAMTSARYKAYVAASIKERGKMSFENKLSPILTVQIRYSKHSKSYSLQTDFSNVVNFLKFIHYKDFIYSFIYYEHITRIFTFQINLLSICILKSHSLSNSNPH